ncbi:hypothetical protein CC78DRAFT_574494 [Lojkania enalia]|uniref:Uncharacterized protein n=1 Tax=Lojkania enalia TaxID=147567 RepID=A0A9P4TNS5_9PLEO|nr:hypothetical protein CC78DRAFT_574494 [Didymosphaeria enalia]
MDGRIATTADSTNGIFRKPNILEEINLPKEKITTDNICLNVTRRDFTSELVEQDAHTVMMSFLNRGRNTKQQQSGQAPITDPTAIGAYLVYKYLLPFMKDESLKENSGGRVWKMENGLDKNTDNLLGSAELAIVQVEATEFGNGYRLMGSFLCTAC